MPLFALWAGVSFRELAQESWECISSDWIFAQELCQVHPSSSILLQPLPAEVWPLLSTQGNTNPSGSCSNSRTRGPQGPKNLRQTNSRAPFTKKQKVDKCNGCRGHCGQLNTEVPTYLCSKQFWCNFISLTTPQQFPSTLMQCYFTSIGFASGGFVTSLKLYFSSCMVVILVSISFHKSLVEYILLRNLSPCTVLDKLPLIIAWQNISCV